MRGVTVTCEDMRIVQELDQRIGKGWDMRYREGDIVRHTGDFLRSVGLYAGAPVNGIVRRVQEGLRDVLVVEWSDGETSSILTTNVEPCPRALRERGPDGERGIANMRGIV